MSSCSCIYDSDGYGPEASTTKIRKARKQHRCFECGRTIEPGEKYEYISGIWDGAPSSYKTCLDCLSLRDVFFCGGWIYGEVWNEFREWLYEGEIEGIEAFLAGDDMRIERLTPTARNMALDMAQTSLTEYLEEYPFRFAKRLDAMPHREIWRWNYYYHRKRERDSIESACFEAQEAAEKRMTSTI